MRGKDAKKAKIRSLVEQLMNADTMNGKIQIACDLWKALFDASLSYISPNKQGYDKISVKDESLLLDLKRVIENSNDYQDAAFCVEAISRSLSINLYSNIYRNNRDLFINVFEQVFFMENQHIVDLNNEAIDNLTIEEKNAMASLIDVHVFFDLTNGVKNSFLSDFENYSHGIMSAFLLTKNLGVFQNLDYTKAGQLNLAEQLEQPAEQMLTLAKILKAISFHTSEGFSISVIDDDSFLTFIDELEEFSRISRASQNREYVKEFCETYIGLDEEGWLNIDFEFHNDNLDNLDPEISFKGRCKRFLSLFDIAHMSPSLKIRVSCIGKLPTDQNTYVLEIANHHADIIINGESQDIPKYLKASQFYTKEEYSTI